MAQVVLNVDGRPYTMQCNEGEEEYLRQLGQSLEDEIATIKRSVGQVGDTRLLLMAGLVIADRLNEAQNKLDGLREHITTLEKDNAEAAKRPLVQRPAVTTATSSFENGVEQPDLHKITERLEAATNRVQALTRSTSALGLDPNQNN